MTPQPTKASDEDLSIGFVSGIDVSDDDIVVIVDVTEGSFIEWIEQEVARGSIELEL